MTTYYAGLDLHKRYLTLCVLDSPGQVVREQRRLASTVEAVTGQLPSDGVVTVVLEATLQWAWFHTQLTSRGYRVLVAHPQQRKVISQARCKTDPIEARKLVELGRVNLVLAIWVPDAATRERRLRLRGRAWLAVVPVPAAVRAEIEVALALIASLDAQIAGYDRLIRQWARTLPEAQLLQSVPGIGPFGALLLLAELGTITRFRSSRELVAYAGLVPSTRSSGGKTAHGGVGPAGSGWLKWIWIEAVQTLKRRPGPVQAHYERLLRAKGKPKATVAAARKLGCYLYWMLREGWSYDEWLQHETARTGCPMHLLASPVGVV
jgi:transposase